MRAASRPEGMMATAPESAFGARLYTSYLEGSTIAVTGSVSQEIRSRGRCQASAECPGERAG
jgi:hypothetical protein